jgi:hypothetical protein
MFPDNDGLPRDIHPDSDLRDVNAALHIHLKTVHALFVKKRKLEADIIEDWARNVTWPVIEVSTDST